ncbi:hypothetical protein [Deinococcus cellulosilyticus]|uniref:Uncharacterized protein n=1 Tax=Deinococcus cellulosilyticus (strain DSM 18568 / NBRC 106333 / KACC 11606 / 5516J-15) TaxID=1223518 RepID=A0A511N1J3_DEIC1|nr:hypothetical protein [Deinococcus cellulosilyticus]GEM46338.1 hypothetical protein DC3_19730 [Deinococcus cellulosilyticus NBRC 106333 = KACC 11606]
MIESVLARAKREFLANTGYSSPALLISSGLRTVEEWSLCLDRCRDEEADRKTASPVTRKKVGRPRTERK